MIGKLRRKVGWNATFGQRLENLSANFASVSTSARYARHYVDKYRVVQMIPRYILEHRAAQPYQIQSTVWQPPNDDSQRIKILEAELRFWFANPRKQHHALFDARRLKAVAEQV